MYNDATQIQTTIAEILHTRILRKWEGNGFIQSLEEMKKLT